MKEEDEEGDEGLGCEDNEGEGEAEIEGGTPFEKIAIVPR